MANLPNFLGAGQSIGGKTPFDNYLKGFGAYLDTYKPSLLQGEINKNTEAVRAQQLATQLQQSKLPYANEMAALDPQLQRAKLAQMMAETEKTRMFGGAGDLSGDIGNSIKLALMEQRLGSDHPLVQAGKQEQARMRANQESLINNRDKNTETADKRAATVLGKKLQELEEAEAGFRPGSNYSIPLSPQERQQILNRYNLSLLKETTDPTTRNKTLLASNIDKTLKQINPDDLFRYSGIAGGIEKKLQQSKALTSKETEDYRKYEESLSAVDLLASQVRQFYGDSVTTTMRKHLEEITNPASWTKNPELAKRKYNTVKNILEQETETYRSGLHNPSEFQGALQNASKNYSEEDINHTAKLYGVTPEEVKAELEKRNK